MGGVYDTHLARGASSGQRHLPILTRSTPTGGLQTTQVLLWMTFEWSRCAAAQLSREYCTDRAVAMLSHTAYGARTTPAQGSDRATSATSNHVRTAATVRVTVAAPMRCRT